MNSSASKGAFSPCDSFDSGLACLRLIAQYHHVAYDADQLLHQFPADESQRWNTTQIIKAGRSLKLKVKQRQVDFGTVDLDELPLPCIAATHEGRYVVVARARQDKILIQEPSQTTPRIISRTEFCQLASGQCIFFSKRDLLSKANEKFNLGWFVTALRKYKKILFQVVLASFFIQLFALISPLFFQVVVDKVLVHHSLNTLDVLCLALLLISVFDIVLNGLRTYVFSHTTNRVDVVLGARLFSHLMNLPLAYFSNRQVGNTVARVHELDSIRQFITGSALTLIIDLFFTIVFFAVMAFYSPTLTWIVAASIPAYVLLSLLVLPQLRKRLDEKFKRGAENQAFLVESLTGVETLKAMALEPQMQSRWEQKLAAYVTASFRAGNIGNIASQSAGLINKVVTVLILWVGATLVIKGELSVGQLIAFNMIAGRIGAPLLKLVQLWQDFQQARISLDRLGDILNCPTETNRSSSHAPSQRLQGKIQFDNISFRYRPDSPPVINQFNLNIKAGEVIGIVGQSGSGKSTLTKLIQRLYQVEQGRVLIDGVDVCQLDPGWLRRQVGVVLQESTLFNGTVRENIALTNPALSMDKVVEAARLAGAHEFILDLPQAYDTLVGERGAALSGGQRQRIAIARALINNPATLILDEATSALDYESERAIQDNMAEICRGRTVIVIAHRLSTVRMADRILVLEKGRLIEQGSHDSLVNQDGYYKKLLDYQNTVPAIRRGPEVASC